jgi:hypothetical protein
LILCATPPRSRIPVLPKHTDCIGSRGKKRTKSILHHPITPVICHFLHGRIKRRVTDNSLLHLRSLEAQPTKKLPTADYLFMQNSATAYTIRTIIQPSLSVLMTIVWSYRFLSYPLSAAQTLLFALFFQGFPKVSIEHKILYGVCRSEREAAG